MKKAALLLSLLGLVAWSQAASADPRQVALGSQGKLYRLEAGPMGRLFPNDPTATTPVLALTIQAPGLPTQRLLVPGTEGEEAESFPAIFFEESSSSAYIVWESRSNYIHSQIRLVSFKEGYFSRDIELTGTFFSLKSSPSLAVTRDSFFSFDAAGAPIRHQRTIYHAIWWEEASTGERVIYSPVVLVDGVYIGWNPTFVLNDLLTGLDVADGALPHLALARSPSIQAGRNGDSVIVSMVEPKLQRLVQFEVAVVAGELTALASSTQDTLLAGGVGLYPANLPALSDRARAQLVDLGRRLGMHPGLLDYLGAKLQADLFAPGAGSQPLASLADKARAQLVDLGFKLVSQGLGQPHGDQTWLVEFTSDDPNLGTGKSPLHSISLALTAARPTPATEPGATTLYASRSGRETLVAWQFEHGLRYLESTESGWSGVHELLLGEGLDVSEAHFLLEQRIRNR